MPATENRTPFYPIVPTTAAHRRGQGRVRTLLTGFAIAIYAGLILLARIMPSVA